MSSSDDAIWSILVLLVILIIVIILTAFWLYTQYLFILNNFNADVAKINQKIDYIIMNLPIRPRI